MTGEQAIRTRLLSIGAITALIGQRIWPHTAPSSSAAHTLPYIVYRAVDKVHEHHLNGASGVCFSRVQLDLIAVDYEAVKILANTVREALDGFRGDVTVGTDLVRVVHCNLELEIDDYDPPIDGSQKGRFRVIHDWKVGYQESIPAFAGA
jgi:hypothetical protein